MSDLNRARLAVLSEAWRRGDLATIVACFDPDGIYAASVGPEPGETFVGRAAIEAGVKRMLALDAGSDKWFEEPVFAGDLAVVTWTYATPNGDGGKTVRGCDVFTFRGGLILKKDAFRKTAAPQDPSAS
jgi:hypothetical protein